MLLHLTNDPSKQLVSVKFENLDVAGLIRLLAQLLDIKLTLPSGSDILFFRVLNVYISTGVVLQGVTYPAGIRFDTDMTVFGKKAIMHAELSSNTVAIKGSIEGFNLGALVVSGATGADPSIDIEFSSAVQKIRIDGAVKIGDNKIRVDIHAQFAPARTFYFLIEVQFVDALWLELRGTLEGVPGQNVDGCEYHMYGKMEQKLVEYIVDLANEHFEKEGDPNRKLVLYREAREAEKNYDSALQMYHSKAEKCELAVRVGEEEIQKTRQLKRDTKIAADEKLQAFRATKQNEERELRARIEREREVFEQEERERTAAMVLSVEQYSVAEIELDRASVELWGRSRRATAATKAKQSATGMFSGSLTPLQARADRTNRGT